MAKLMRHKRTKRAFRLSKGIPIPKFTPEKRRRKPMNPNKIA
jgi:hypothetical protein